MVSDFGFSARGYNLCVSNVGATYLPVTPFSLLETQLRQFDGRNSDSLLRVAGNLSPDSSTIDQLIGLAERSDPPLQTAATWLLKHFQSGNTCFTPTQVAKVIDCICRPGSWESRLHLVQMLPDLTIPAQCSEELFQSLLRARSDSNKFIRAWAYSGLHTLASQHSRLVPEVVPLLDQAALDESSSVRARLRQLKPLFPDSASSGGGGAPYGNSGS